MFMMVEPSWTVYYATNDGVETSLRVYGKDKLLALIDVLLWNGIHNFEVTDGNE